jgi:holin-like protein
MTAFLRISVQILILFGIYQAGVYLQTLLGVPIPGSIIGLLLLFGMLTLKVLPVSLIEDGSRFLLKHLTLFFVPVTVGVMQYGYVFRGQGVLLIPAVLLSTILVMALTGKLFEYLMAKKSGERYE